MSCACGHHHSHQDHDADVTGVTVEMERPLIGLTGKLICSGTDELMLALSLLPDHVKLSRAERGCLRFDIWLTDDPMVWQLSELFVDEDAFAAHQTRTQGSEWGQKSTSLKRDFQKRDILPIIRAQRPDDADGILRIMESQQLSQDELQELQEKGVLSGALVAEAASVLLGYVGLQDGDIIGPFTCQKMASAEINGALRQEVMRFSA